MAHYPNPAKFHNWYSPQNTMHPSMEKDSGKYAFAQCLVLQTTRTFNPGFNFQRLVTSSPFYTESIQKLVLSIRNLPFYLTYLPTADVVLHTYKKVFEPIVRYHTEIGYDPQEVLMFGTFLGFYCAQLYSKGVKDAPDFAVIALADALKFFDDTEQFEDDGWLKLDTCALYLLNETKEQVDEMTLTSKMGGRIKTYLKCFLTDPYSEEKDILCNNALQKPHQTPYSGFIKCEPMDYQTTTLSSESSGCEYAFADIKPFLECRQRNSRRYMGYPLYYELQQYHLKL